MNHASESKITVGKDVVTVKRSGSSKLIVANILGHETDAEGSLILYVDRLVHAPHESELGEYKVFGAISTCIRIPMQSDAAQALIAHNPGH